MAKDDLRNHLAGKNKTAEDKTSSVVELQRKIRVTIDENGKLFTSQE